MGMNDLTSRICGKGKIGEDGSLPLTKPAHSLWSAFVFYEVIPEHYVATLPFQLQQFLVEHYFVSPTWDEVFNLDMRYFHSERIVVIVPTFRMPNAVKGRFR